MARAAIAVKKDVPAEYADIAEVLKTFLDNRAERTRRAYLDNLADFGRYLGLDTAGEGLAALIALGPAGAYRKAGEYRAELLKREYAPASINQRLAALRSFMKVAQKSGLVNWNLGIENVKAETYRDTRGPGAKGVQKLLLVLRKRGDKKAIRDRALVFLQYARVMRRAEVAALDLADVDIKGSTLNVKRKGKRQKVRETIGPITAEVLAAWIAERGDGPGPLFYNLSRDGDKAGERITGTGIYDVITTLGKIAGVKVTPHGLRHAGITEGLDRTGDVRAVRDFSRHAKLETLLIYDDTRRDLGGEVARMVEASVIV